MAILNTVYGR